MKRDSYRPIDLDKAQSLILRACSVLPEERVSLGESVKRFPVRSLKALEPLPGYDQSLRDGYAIGDCAPKSENTADDVYRIIGEVAAGDTRKLRLGPGEAVRIMTGGLVPTGGRAVVPQELCHCENNSVRVPLRFLKKKGAFVHARGSEFAKGRVLVSRGVVITSQTQILLAGAGYETVPVVRRPRIAFFCTGSELVSDQSIPLAGQKISANSSLLQGLISRNGCMAGDQQTVMDDCDAVLQLFNNMDRSDCDILISTGGMGQGKYDLIEEAFARVGGKPIFHSLRLRPGKSMLFGTLGNTLFFGLPGPPPAVHFLFDALVRPAILALQGAKRCRPLKVKGYLTEELHLAKGALPRFKGGVLHCADGSCQVRPSKRGEPSNCYIFCPAARRKLRKREKVTLHLLDSFPCST